MAKIAVEDIEGLFLHDRYTHAICSYRLHYAVTGKTAAILIAERVSLGHTTLRCRLEGR